MAISRFRVPDERQAQFRGEAEAVVAQFAGSTGCEGAELVQNLDDPQLWAVISRWAQVGDYRRAFNGTAAKMVLIPLLSLAIDEPSAYTSPDDVGANVPRVG